MTGEKKIEEILEDIESGDLVMLKSREGDRRAVAKKYGNYHVGFVTLGRDRVIITDTSQGRAFSNQEGILTVKEGKYILKYDGDDTIYRPESYEIIRRGDEL